MENIVSPWREHKIHQNRKQNSTKGEITIRVNGVDYKPITGTLVYDNSEDKLTNATCDGEPVEVDTKSVAGWGEAIYCSLLQSLGVEDTGEEE